MIDVVVHHQLVPLELGYGALEVDVLTIYHIKLHVLVRDGERDQDALSLEGLLDHLVARRDHHRDDRVVLREGDVVEDVAAQRTVNAFGRVHDLRECA